MTQADESPRANQPANAEHPPHHADTTQDTHDTGALPQRAEALDAEPAATLSAGGYGGEQEYPDTHEPLRDSSSDLGSQPRNQTDMTDMSDDASTAVPANDV